MNVFIFTLKGIYSFLQLKNELVYIKVNLAWQQLKLLKCEIYEYTSFDSEFQFSTYSIIYFQAADIWLSYIKQQLLFLLQER